MTIIELTREGRKMNRVHRYFHEKMVLTVGEELDDAELECLLRCIRKLNAFFEEQL